MNDYIERISLKNKNIIVTGACGLLGSEISKGISELQGNVIIVDINYSAAERLKKEIESKYKTSPHICLLDITSEKAIINIIEELKEKFNSIDGLINNAYPRNKSYGIAFEHIKYNDWRENIDMHLNGYFNITQKVSQIMMKQKRGKIINMASIYGFLGPDFSIYEGTTSTMPAEYSAIKGAIINFTKYLATYLCKYNINVNSISPGGVYNNQPEEFVNNYISKTPLGRMANPEDITGGIIYLLSDLANYVTGHNLVIDGGWSIW